MPQLLRRFCTLLLLIPLAAFVPVARPALAATITVRSAADSGPDTLRDAINRAQPGDTIVFDPGVTTITLASPLPAITRGNITIDGTRSDNTPHVQIRGNGLPGQGLLIKSSGNTIRGLIINGFESDVGSDDYGGAGIVISAYGVAEARQNTVEYCYLGTDASGNGVGYEPKVSNNPTAGLLILSGASDNRIQNNVISGNGGKGIQLAPRYSRVGEKVQNGNTISNNRIGVNASGTAALGNANHGISIIDNTNNTMVGPGNLISGNGNPQAFDPGYGVLIDGKTESGVLSGNKVQGNLIGTNAGGTAAIPNGGGVRIGSARDTLIGGPDTARNIISGNTGYGIALYGRPDVAPDANKVDIQNNIIGLNQAGNAALGNTRAGIILDRDIANVTIGPGNVVSGNGTNGIEIYQVSNNTIIGNRIGTDGLGNTAIPNTFNGISIIKDPQDQSNPTNNRIGGPNPNDGNLISGNRQQGILIQGGGASNNTIERNRVERNGDNGILIKDGALNNRVTRTTTTSNGTAPGSNGFGIRLVTGGNRGFAPPQIGNLTVTGAAPNQTLSGTISSDPACGPGCTVEAFQSGTQENNEGAFFLASAAVGDNGSFSISIQSCQPFLTFTLTDGAGNTSPFSAAYGPVAGCSGTPPPQGAAPELMPASLTQPGAPGATVTFQHTLRNKGDAQGTFTLSVDGVPAGWSAAVSPATPVTLDAGQSIAVQLAVTLPAGAAAPDAGNYPLTLTAAVGGSSATSSANDTIQVPLSAGVELTPPGQTIDAGPGQQISLVHTLKNTGNGQDTFTISVTAPDGWNATVQGGTTVTLAKGESRTITVLVSIPPNAAPSPPDYSIRVTAISNTDSSKSATATGMVRVRSAAVPQISAGTTQSANPGAQASFGHTITNVGNQGGTFVIEVIPPAGWTLTAAPPLSVTLAAGQSTTIAFTVRSPDTAIAGPYPITVRATAADANAATASVIDTVTINEIAGLDLSGDQQSQEEPATVVTYTFTLRNTGNFTDTFNLNASVESANAARGWSAKPIPAAVAIPPGAEAQIDVALTIPLGQPAGRQNVTTLTATSSKGLQDSAQITTQIKPIAKALLLPPELRRSTTVTQPVLFEYTLYNSGSITQSFTVTTTDVPPGWTNIITVTPPPIDFTPGQTATVQLLLRAPEGTPDGRYVFTIKATPTDPNGKSSTALARLRIGPPIDIDIEPDRSAEQPPGTFVQYSHTVTNTGQISGTFTLSARSALGWQTLIAPVNVQLEPDQSVPITVTVLIPTSASAGAQDVTTVTAQSDDDARVTDSVTDTTTVRQVAGVGIAPSRTTLPRAGQQIRFQHVLLNMGNGPDGFIITATHDLAWKLTVVPTETVTLGSGIFYPFEIRVEIPPDASPTAVDRIRVRATSKYDPAVFAELTDSIRPAGAAAPASGRRAFLPIIARRR